MYNQPNFRTNYMTTGQNEANIKALVIGAVGVAAYFFTKIVSGGPGKKQWELLSSTNDKVSHPVDIGVQLKTYKGINESKGKFNVDWRRADGRRGTVYADTENAAIKKALKEAEES